MCHFFISIISSYELIDIPGFYYDEDTKKYFRITKDHPGPKRKAEKTPIRKVFIPS